MIVISAGHYDGAKGAAFGPITEYPLTLVWAQRIAEYLRSMSVPVVIAPSDTLGKKVQFINDLNKGHTAVWAAVEIHFNAGGGQGTETLYFPGSKKGEALARAVQEKLWPVFGKDRGVKEGWYQQDLPGVVDYPGDVDGDEKLLYFLEKTTCPAIIIEPEFIEHYDSIQAKREEACRVIAGVLHDRYSSFI